MKQFWKDVFLDGHKRSWKVLENACKRFWKFIENYSHCTVCTVV